MLTLSTRSLRDLTHDPATGCYSARVDLIFREAPDEPEQKASLRATLTLPHRARFNHIEAALLDEAERLLRIRLHALGAGPKNIFAPRRHVIVMPERQAPQQPAQQAA